MRYIAFDCETSGLSSQSNLLTVCFIVLDANFVETDRLSIALQQTDGYHVYPEALSVNGIDLIKHHNTSTDLDTARERLANFLTKNRGAYNLIPIGHNISFDIGFIQSSGLLTQKEYNQWISHNSIDTLVVAQFLKTTGSLPSKQSISLVNLCKYFGIIRKPHLEHNCEYDTEMTIQLLKRLIVIVQHPSSNIQRKRKRI